MIRSLYTAASGLMLGLRAQDVIANNLANSETSGFKGETSAATAFDGVLARRVTADGSPLGGGRAETIGRIGTGTYQSVRSTDFAPGSQAPTGQELDAAIEGGGFFAVEVDGAVRYTRDGHFGRDGQNRLVARDGSVVLDVDGQPIPLPGDIIVFRPNGEVLADGTTVARLQVASLDESVVARAGQSRFIVTGGAAPTVITGQDGVAVRQGMLEEANVDVTSTATDLMGIQRVFNASQNVFTTVDQTLERAVLDIGRL